MSKLNIAIAGCGIAGLACAAFLARAGHAVTIFDKLTQPAPVGSGLILQPVGLAVLAKLGAAEKIEALGAPLARLFGRSQPSGRVVLDVRYSALGAGVQGLAVHRAALFNVLHATAASAGAAFVSGKTVYAAAGGHGGRQLVFADRTAAGPFDLVIDALGARSDLSVQGRQLAYGALWANLTWPDGAGFDPGALEQRYEHARRMVGVMPVGRLDEGGANQAAFFWSLKHDDYTQWRVTPLGIWKRDVLRLWPQTAPLLDQIASHDDLIMARYAHRTLARPVEPALVHMGDAWHCTSPQLGQGANFALLDALALARALERETYTARALALYARLRRSHVGLYQLASFLFTPAYQSDSNVLPWLRDRIVGPLSRLWPAPQALASLVAGAWTSPLRRIG